MSAARRTEGVLLTVAALVPAALAAARVDNVPDAARDAAVLRVLGLEPRVWRGLDTAVALLLQPAPVGTRAARAALGGALVAAATGAVLFGILRALLDACAPTRRLGALVALVAALLPLVGAPWQTECASVGGLATGALLVLAPLWLLGTRSSDGSQQDPTPPRPGALHAAVFSLGLAVGYEPLVGACALAGAATLALLDGRARRLVTSSRAHAGSLCLAFVVALAPCALGIARVRSAGIPLAQALGTEGGVEGLAPSSHAPLAILWTQLGPAVLAFAGGGLVLAAVVPRARPLAVALLAVAVAGVASARLLPCGPSLHCAPLLAALAAVCALAGAGMQALVRFVASARVPLARASAAMVLLLEVVLPVDAADEALARPAGTGAVGAWDDAAWGELAPATVILLPGDTAWQRARVASARGSLRGDVTVVPSAAPGSAPVARRALASDPALLSLWRDLEISGAPSEASLSTVAAARPLVMVHQPAWGRVLAGHLVPDGLLDRFELEPRGASDRRTALEAFSARRERLARDVHGDPDLSAETARILRARAILFVTLDPHDVDAAAAAVRDVQAFAPDDPVAAQVTARLAAKGPPRFDDLRP
jgi:hypothetical protein